ncbi:hypothetical protein GCM10009799_29930 [Nocardiopsis rhodophaea]|uniref:Uncharacterized protein n=1 Tax=Nocardiopsis rhodophaea TaxID=280238 RepID=A0ABN2T774_9ACTN
MDGVTEARRWSLIGMLAWVGVALAIAGGLLAVVTRVAALVVEADEYWRDTNGGWIWAIGIAAVVSEAALHRRLEDDLPHTGQGQNMYTLVLVSSTVVTFLAACIYFPETTFVSTTDETSSYSPDPFLAVTWASLCAVGVGTMLLVCAESKPCPRPLRTAIAGVAMGVLLVISAAAVAAAASLIAPTRQAGEPVSQRDRATERSDSSGTARILASSEGGRVSEPHTPSSDSAVGVAL